MPRILIIDDSGIMLRILKLQLSEFYTVDIAVSGPLALKKMQTVMPDLILLDYEMPEMNGEDTFYEIKKLPGGDSVPIIFLSGVDDVITVEKIMSLKPEGYILKPPSTDKLLQLIEKTLKG